MNADQLLEVYDELNYPGSKAFLKELRKRGIPAREKDVKDFIQAQPEQQILAGGPTYKGAIHSARLDDRWVADLIDYTSQPVGKITHVLIVQDIFSRFIWTAALAGTAQATQAFQQVLDKTGRSPRELNSDRGTEWTNARVKELCERKGIGQRFKEGRNDIATIDAAISVLRPALTKRSARSGKPWPDELAAATKGVNGRARDALADASATEVKGDIPLRIDLRVENTQKSIDNEQLMEKRDAKLREMGAFRRLENTKSFARGWKPKWSTKLFQVAEVGHGIVKDTEGNEAMTKEVLAVPAETAPLQPPSYVSNVNQTRANALQQYADVLAQSIAGRPDIFVRTAAAELRRKQPGFEVERKKQRVQTFLAFLQLFPKIFRVEGNKVSARRQPTLATRPQQQLQRLRRMNTQDQMTLDSFR